MKTSLIASTLTAALLAGCAQSPAQVAATEPVRSVRFSTGAAAMAKCLQAGIENMVPIWTVSVRGEADRPRVQVHGGVDAARDAGVAARARPIELAQDPLARGRIDRGR